MNRLASGRTPHPSPIGNIMKISQVNIDSPIQVETQTDAYRVIRSEWHRGQFIAEYGDVEVEYDSVCQVYRVPNFAEIIADYVKVKANSLAYRNSR